MVNEWIQQVTQWNGTILAQPLSQLSTGELIIIIATILIVFRVADLL